MTTEWHPRHISPCGGAQMRLRTSGHLCLGAYREVYKVRAECWTCRVTKMET